jgi:chromosome segregation ATPase
LWGLSGALGDHVANCFLHIVYERGIGVPRDASVAIRYQDAARATGGCQHEAASGDKATFTDARRLPAGGIERTDAVTADIREWAQERQEMKRALSDAYVRHKQDADKLATLEAEMKLKKDEIARLVADLDERMKSIQSWSSNHSELTGRLAEAKREHARLTAALAAERESRAAAEAQRVNSDEQDAFNAALNTARRLAGESAQKSK